VAGCKGGKGDHLSRRVADVKLFQVLGQHAEGGIRLGVDPLDPPGADEVVDVGTAEGRGDGVVNGSDGEAQGPGLAPVHVDVVLGNILHPVGPHVMQPRIGRRHGQELVARLHQGFVTHAAQVLQLEVEPLGLAQLDDRRWGKRHHDGVPVL